MPFIKNGELPRINIYKTNPKGIGANPQESALDKSNPAYEENISSRMVTLLNRGASILKGNPK